MNSMMRWAIIFFLAAACGRDDDRSNGRETLPPDSAGWRDVNLDSVSFRYPVARVRSVIDRRSPDCSLGAGHYGEGPDSTVDASIIVSYGPADFDSIAHVFGFE